MAYGGKREGSGRKPGARSALSKQAVDVAAQVLREVDALKIWKALLTSGDTKVIADVLKYLTNRVHGMPAQTIQGDASKPLTVTLQWGSKPDWIK